jgi:hypothetical protein
MPEKYRRYDMITIYVKIKNVYGVEKVYPDCPVSEVFASLTKTKTLSDNDLGNILKLGYKIEMKPKLQFASLVSEYITTRGE